MCLLSILNVSNAFVHKQIITKIARTVDHICQNVVFTKPEWQFSAEEGLGRTLHCLQIKSIVDMASIHNIDCQNEFNKFRL